MTSGEYQQLVDFLGRQFTGIDRRFEALDRKFTGHIAELRQEMLGHFDEIDRRFERLEQEYHE
jgi:hypothetical protein